MREYKKEITFNGGCKNDINYIDFYPVDKSETIIDHYYHDKNSYKTLRSRITYQHFGIRIKKHDKLQYRR